jgi:glycosyltransferase involved in cell wall biosynthesis
MYRRAIAGPSPDLVVGADPPQIVGYFSVRLASRFQIPVILDVFDLWPELFKLAFPRPLRCLTPVVLFPLYQLRKHNLRRATALTALCYTYLQGAIRVAPIFLKRSALTVFNGIDVSAFRHLAQDDDGKVALAAKMGKRPGEVWAIFAGSLGNNYDIMALLRASCALARHESPIKILIVGAGPLRERVTKFVERIRPNNLEFLGKLDNEQLIRLYGICDIGLCTYSPDSNVSMPDKAYDYMAAGLPIVNSLRGELEAFLQKNKIGVQYSAGDSYSLASSLDDLALDCQLRRVMAKNSYQAASQFDSRVQYGIFADFVEKIARST